MAYTYNQFQYDSSLEYLKKRISEEPKEHKECIFNCLTECDFIMDKEYNHLLNLYKAVGISTLIGEGASIYLACTGDYTLGSAVALLSASPVVGILISSGITGINILNMNKKLTKMSENIYKVMLDTILEAIENPHVLTDQDIHEMTLSLKNGEVEDKYREMQNDGKLAITILELDEYTPTVFEEITDPSLQRLFEILMHYAVAAEEGYESLLKEAFDFIREYTKYISSGKRKVEDDRKYQDIINSYEERVRNAYRKK